MKQLSKRKHYTCPNQILERFQKNEERKKNRKRKKEIKSYSIPLIKSPNQRFQSKTQQRRKSDRERKEREKNLKNPSLRVTRTNLIEPRFQLREKRERKKKRYTRREIKKATDSCPCKMAGRDQACTAPWTAADRSHARSRLKRDLRNPFRSAFGLNRI